MSGLAMHVGRRICSRLPMHIRPSPIADATWIRFLSSTESDETQSARSAFQQTPVNPSILKYVQRVGVGKAERKKRRNKGKSRFLTESEEKDQFGRVRKHLSTTTPPPFPSSDRRENTSLGKKVRRTPVKLLKSVGSLDSEFPKASLTMPEVAIAGRSNVGKSTLLNALLYGTRKVEETERDQNRRRRRLIGSAAKLPRGIKAATSAKPGETREISFYQLSAKVDDTRLSMLLVDLPGYGFAFASEEKAKQWQALMKSYIVGRGKSLKRILLLIDARHGMKKADFDFLESMQNSLLEQTVDLSTTPKKRELPPIQLVLTKCDLVSQSDLVRRMTLVQRQLSDSLRREPSALPIMLVSAQIDGQAGVLELQKELAALIPRNATQKEEKTL